jgi:phosphohistidine phosphatase
VKCYFLRHGIAVEPDEWKGTDFERPLTPDGRQRMEREAKAIAEVTLGIEAIVTSPLVRARQTAEIVAGALGLRDALVDDERLGVGFGLELLAPVIASQREVEALMLVGHEPSFSATVGQLVGKARVEIKKGAVAGVELARASATHGTLICLIPPKVLAALGKARGRS